MNEIVMRGSGELIRPKTGDIFKVNDDYCILTRICDQVILIALDTGMVMAQYTTEMEWIDIVDFTKGFENHTWMKWEYIGACEIKLRKLKD